MTWNAIGWTIIGLAALLLLFFRLLFGRRGRYLVREQPAVHAFLEHRERAIERGEKCLISLGDRFWSRAYPALGLQSLSVTSKLASLGPGGLEEQFLATGSGELALFVRQILQGDYRDGYSMALNLVVPGPTPYAFMAGFLADLHLFNPGSVGLFGNYGTTGAVNMEAAEKKGAHSFAAAGSVSTQAALFLTTRDLLIGEEVYLLPGLFDELPENQATWISEDILRVLLIALLVIAAGLKMVGIL